MTQQTEKVKATIDEFLAKCDDKGIPREKVAASVAFLQYDPDFIKAFQERYRMKFETRKEDYDRTISVDIASGGLSILFGVQMNGSYASRDELARDVIGVFADYGIPVDTTKDLNAERWETLRRFDRT